MHVSHEIHSVKEGQKQQERKRRVFFIDFPINLSLTGGFKNKQKKKKKKKRRRIIIIIIIRRRRRRRRRRGGGEGGGGGGVGG